MLKVHRADCTNLESADPSRLVALKWDDIRAPEPIRPGGDYDLLDELDFRILSHHERCGIDYSLKVARMLGADRETVFERHRQLRERGLLVRVEPTMVQYRRGIAPNKWIKHRNHTYYDLTDVGRGYLEYFILKGRSDDRRTT